MRLIIEWKGERREFRVPEGISIVGRDPASDICVPEGSLSRRHLEVELTGERIVVRDLETKNGTFVGQQRINEARLQPGTRLRAGNVWMRFEKADVSDAQPLETGAAQLEARVPDAPDFQADDTPTPADESAAQAAGEAAGTEMIIRDGRWFVRDLATGAEVEVVPSSTPAGEAAPVVLPAVVTRREGTAVAAARAATPVGRPPRRALKIALVALPAVIAATALIVLLLPGKPGIQYLSLESYREQVAAAVTEYEEGRAEAAAELLERVRSQPMETRMELPGMLLAAFKADIAAHGDFEKSFEEADRCWSEVNRSAESGGVPTAGELATKRLAWINDETLNMAALTEARRALTQREYLSALNYALKIEEGSRFYKDAPAIVEESTSQLKKEVGDQAAAQHWTAAIGAAQSLMNAVPSLTDELSPKVAQYRAYDEQRKTVQAARDETEAGKPGRAVEALGGVPQDSPYYKEAAALLTQARNSALFKQAEATYNAGDGPKALEILSTLPNANPELVERIKRVIAANAAAYAALKETEFATAADKFNEILAAEKPEVNHYAADAKGRLAAMANMKGAAAKELVKAADDAAERREFRVARRKYAEAATLDPTNRGAVDGPKKLIEWAVRDYNRALILKKDDPESALKLYQEVAERLPPDHALAAATQMEILNLKLQIGRNPVAPEQPAGGK